MRFREVAKRIPGARSVYLLLCGIQGSFSILRHALRKLGFIAAGGRHYSRARHYNAALVTALGKNSRSSDISDHLSTIFFFAVNAQPHLIVELGTRGGESTRALLAAASLTNAIVLSVDLSDCQGLHLPFNRHWRFVQGDDLEFGHTGFENWCRTRAIQPSIDVLFVDTSHECRHTKQEFQTWGSFLSEKGIMILHDTNMRSGIVARNDGSVGFGWDNKRGTMRAVEELMQRRYDENSFFCDVTGDFSLIHFPNCNGLTIIKKRL